MIYFTGHIKEGVLRFRHRKFVDALFQKQPDGDVQITIEPLKAIRSLRLLRYYWGVVVKTLSEATGHTPEEMHEYLKQRFNGKIMTFNEAGGVKTLWVGGTTTKMNNEEMLVYIDKIKVWSATDLNIHIPDPAPEEGEYYYER